MLSNNATTKLKEIDVKGSRGRCLMLTSMSRNKVASILSELVSPHALVEPDDLWIPRGYVEPDEAKLGETAGFLDRQKQKELTDWWLEVPRNANTPNWDIVSTCKIDGKQGLVLVEAKAHLSELSCSCKPEPTTENGERNHIRIRSAVEEANSGLSSASMLPGWSLTIDCNYQLSNRFAWAWKIATLGVPVVLVYLGFLNTLEMDCSGRTIFTNGDQWKQAMHTYADSIIPPTAWERRINIGNTPLVAIIRSTDVNIAASLSHQTGDRHENS